MLDDVAVAQRGDPSAEGAVRAAVRASLDMRWLEGAVIAGEGVYHGRMHPDDHVCLCFGVSKRKIVNYYRRTRPAVASLINRELPAGTGCQWCVPFVESLHRQVMNDEPQPDLPFSPAEYAKRRLRFRRTGEREQSAQSPPDTGPSDADSDVQADR